MTSEISDQAQTKVTYSTVAAGDRLELAGDAERPVLRQIVNPSATRPSC